MLTQFYRYLFRNFLIILCLCYNLIIIRGENMRIDVLQTQAEGKNEFLIKYDNVNQYVAKLPFVTINDPLNLEKLRQIAIYNLNGNQVYTTDYRYIENLKEEIIPFKFLFTGQQKFNQLLFCSNEKTIKIYHETNNIWEAKYVIEIYNKRFFCYSIEDGYIRHFPIYDGDIQIGEALKSNVVVDGKDEYYCYLKPGYEGLSDGIVSLMLYLDRSEYSSSYVVKKSYDLYKKFSWSRNNKFYDKNWVKNNFGDEFYRKVDNDVAFVKGKFKHPISTSNELIKSSSSNQKKTMILIFVVPWIIILLAIVIILINIL